MRILAALVLATLATAQDNSYEDRNQIDYQIKAGELRGVVRDTTGALIPGAKVLIFSDGQKHALLASTVTDDEGRFAVQKLRWKRVRLVVKYDHLCTANAIVNRSGNQGKLDVVMKPAGVDDCSYVEIKK